MTDKRNKWRCRQRRSQTRWEDGGNWTGKNRWCCILHRHLCHYSSLRSFVVCFGQFGPNVVLLWFVVSIVVISHTVLLTCWSTCFYLTCTPVYHHKSSLPYHARAFNILKLAHISKKKKKSCLVAPPASKNRSDDYGWRSWQISPRNLRLMLLKPHGPSLQGPHRKRQTNTVVSKTL